MAGTMDGRIWVWAHRVDGVFHTFGIQAHSKATPAQGAGLFNAGKLFMALPLSEADAAAVAGFDEVVWRIYAKDGFDFSTNVDAAKALARKYPNIKGVVVDDLTSTEIGRGLKPDDLARLREQVKSGDTPLDLWGVIYGMNLGVPSLGEYMRFLDGVTFWTWESKDLANLASEFGKAEELAQGKPVLLGIYAYDFGGEQPMPMEPMRYQCDMAIKWLQERRIEGVIMHCTCIADLPFPAVDYGREWTGKIAGQSIAAMSRENLLISSGPASKET
jgi:hypothetical protein